MKIGQKISFYPFTDEEIRIQEIEDKKKGQVRELVLQPIKDIPSELNDFYTNVGYFVNQKTNDYVTVLAPHQIQT